MSTKTKIKILQRGGFKRHGLLEEATRWALSELLSTRMANTLSLRIEVRSTKLHENGYGLVVSTANGSKASKKFTVTIHRDHSLTQQLKGLFHELTHVAQYATGRLQCRRWKSDRKFHYRWEGEEMGTEEENPYWNRPWEVEARKMEEELLQKWKLRGR